MFRLIMINFDKKFSFISSIFMLISIVLIFSITIYNASFNLSEFKLLDEQKIVLENYIVENLQFIEFIQVIFIILLVELELFYNTDNFDSYFIVLKGRKNFFIAKIVAYLILIFFYTGFIFIGFLFTYIIRFRTVLLCKLIIKVFLYYMIYFLILFFVTFLLMLLFKNYFSVILVFIYYWISKMIDSKSNFLLTIFPKISFKLEEGLISFNTSIYYILAFLFTLLYVNIMLYNYKDLKINS